MTVIDMFDFIWEKKENTRKEKSERKKKTEHIWHVSFDATRERFITISLVLK